MIPGSEHGVKVGESVPVEVGDDRVGGRSKGPRTIAFCLLALIHLLPLWVFAYFPSQDGPSHLNNANVIREYRRPEATAFRKYYVLNDTAEPNWLGHLLLAGLLSLTPMRVAESLFLSGYVVLFVVSFRYAASACGAGGESAAFLAFPFLYNTTVHKGWYSFAYSLPFFFFFLGYFLQKRERFGSGEAARLALLSLVLYLFHVVSWTLAVFAVGLITAFRMGRELIQWGHSGSSRRELGSLFVRYAVPLISLIPAGLLAARFVRGQGGGARAFRPTLQNLGDLWSGFLVMFVAFDPKEAYVLGVLGGGLALTALVIVVAKVRRRSFAEADPLFLLALSLLVIALVAPDGMLGGSGLRVRLMLFLCLIVILWLAGQRLSRPLQRTIMAAGSLAALVLLGLRFVSYGELDRYLREYVSAGASIEPNRTLLPLCFLPNGPVRNGRRPAVNIESFLHAADYIAVEKRLVDFTNYEGTTALFPVRFRRELNPFVHIGDVENLVERVDFASYEHRTEGTVDYVLLWGARDPSSPVEESAKTAIFRQLQRGYKRVFVSAGGLTELYRREN